MIEDREAKLYPGISSPKSGEAPSSAGLTLPTDDNPGQNQSNGCLKRLEEDKVQGVWSELNAWGRKLVEFPTTVAFMCVKQGVQTDEKVAVFQFEELEEIRSSTMAENKKGIPEEDSYGLNANHST